MIRLDASVAQTKGRHLCAEIRREVTNRRDADHRRMTVRNMYFGNAQRLDIHWEGASDIHLPLISEKTETVVPKWLSALMDAEPAVMLRRPADDKAPEIIREQEQFINWALENDIPDFRETVEGWVRNACLDPVSYVKTVWTRESRSTVEVHRLKSDWQPGQVTFANFQVPEESDPLPKEPVDLLIEIFGAPITVRGQDGLLDFEEVDGGFIVSFVEDRRNYPDVLVRFMPAEFVDEIEVHVARTIMVSDNPCVEVVEFEDMIVPFRSKDIQSAAFVAQQHWKTPSEIQRLVDSGEWLLSDTDMERIHAQKTRVFEEIPENEGAKRALDHTLGEEGHARGASGLEAFSEGKVLIFDVYARDDISGGGEFAEMIYQIPYCLQTVASADYLDTVFPHGRRPFADTRWINVSGRYLGVSMGEFLAPIQVQINTTINQVNDNQELINNPFFFYEPTAFTSDSMGMLRNLQPGQGVPIASAGAVTFPQWTQQPLANLGAGLDPVLLFADRLTVTPQQGGSNQTRNAPRTARGTLALLSEGNQKLDNAVKRHQWGGWAEVVHQILGLYQYYMPAEKWFWVIGDTQRLRRRVTHKQMRGRWETMFQGNTVNTNREVNRILAQQRYQLGMTNPLYATDPQAMLELLRDVMRAHSEGVDVERILPRLPGQGAFQHPPMQQKAENQIMKQGISIDALPVDDHTAHIAEIDRFVATPEFDSLPREFVSLFSVHKRQHQQMIAAQMSAQAQSGIPGQSPTAGGGEQSVASDVGLGGLEGGTP